MTGAAVERVREALAEHDCAPRGSNVKLRARCPVHGSHGPTLAVSQGRSGAVVKCFAACETADILAAIGLSFPDLYDEPRERDQPVRVTRRPPSPAEQLARVLVRGIGIQLAAEAMRHTRLPGLGLTADERVEHAEWASQVEAERHYWRTLARWAALACDETYVRQAREDAWAWVDKRGPRPSHEQFMVLLTRAEDLARVGGVAA